MGIGVAELTGQFGEAGLGRGDTVLFHSSLKSFGFIDGGADAVIAALTNTIGVEGTLVVPTLTGHREDSKSCPPVFDVVNTKCWTGILAETVRNRKDAIRSLHPTHSAAAIGYRKEELTRGHEYSGSPCDEKSPYYINAAVKGYILLAGVDQESNTSIHSCEEIAMVPYHLQPDTVKINITGYGGQKLTVTNRLHNWEKPATDFNKLDELFESKGIMKKYRVGSSLIRLINAYEMFEFTVSLLRKTPDYLLV
ncbi:aminoglycoside N(3)-acetyltransferase [Anaerocolumna xylanovorans]|uniref:Aminoglycoside N(3)-acetyltransferase n=1 Tax=Anaerocolumna xylanovorans DSM 12503 TaxID=1121345 RepID=A0A1M7XWD4_9FIRM|nr:AAC(3) family N-acetyltransferase [Anaerocolumna xylanovorans]SHO43055.1 aminoglycoside 3-N-acetyltransferase [Anaerocolumna xylanovorans DSM 12503]